MKAIAKILTVLWCAVFGLNSIMICFAVNADSYSYNEEYELAKNLGYFAGISAAPDDAISGKDLAQIMHNAADSDISSVYPGLEQTQALKSIDAVKVFLDLAGYKAVIAENGGYPHGYAVWAANLGLTKGMKFTGGEPANLRMIGKLIDNSMNMSMFDEYYEKTSFGKVVLRIEKIKGMVTANSFCGINGSGVGKDSIRIDDKVYTCIGGFNGDDLLGHYVDAYRVVDKEEIRFAAPTRSTQFLNIPAEKVLNFSNDTLKYYNEAGKEKTAAVSSTAVVLKNNAVLGNYSDEDFKLESGEITLVRRNGAGEYDLVIIKSYTDFVVSYIDLGTKTLYNKLDGDKLKFDEAKHIQVRDTEGNILTTNDIAVFDVLSVADSEVSTEVIVSRKKIDPMTVQTRGKADGREYIGSEKARYFIGKSYLEYSSGILPDVGSTISAYLNAFGDVVYISTSQQSMQLGYLLKAGVAYTPFEEPYFRILTTDNTIVNLYCTDKIDISDINGEEKRVKSTEGINRFLNYEGIISYKVNSDEKLISALCPLDKKQPMAQDRLYKSYEGQQTLYRNWAGTLGGGIYLNDSTYIFSIPENRSSDEDCDVLERGDLINGTLYDYTAYCMGDNEILANCLVLTNFQRQIRNEAGYYAVTEIGTAISKTGETVQQIVCSNGDEIVKYRAEYSGSGSSVFDRAIGICGTDPVKIEIGDIIRCTVSARTGLVENAYVLFDANGVNPAYPNGQRGTFPNILGNAPQPDNMSNPLSLHDNNLVSPEFTSYGVRYMYGWVYKKEGNYITITNQDLSSEKFVRDSRFFIENHAANVYKCMSVNMYGRDSIEVKKGGTDDIISYIDGGDACSRVIAITQSQGDPIQLIILND